VACQAQDCRCDRSKSYRSHCRASVWLQSLYFITLRTVASIWVSYCSGWGWFRIHSESHTQKWLGTSGTETAILGENTKKSGMAVSLV